MLSPARIRCASPARRRRCESPISSKASDTMRLASFKANGRAGYGAVVGSGVIDLGRRLPRYPTLLEVLRADAISEARAAANGPPDHQLKAIELLPPIPTPEKNICVGINYPD